MTNTAVASDNAIAQTQSEDALQTLTESMLGASHAASTESMVSVITTLFDSTFQQLIETRDSAYANATEALERESEALAKEYDLLEEGIKAIEDILPAKTRLIQHEADMLLVNGTKQDAANKLAELGELKRKATAMSERQKEYIARIDAIQSEKHDIAKQVFEDWYAKVRPVIRAAERGLFITLLQGLEQSFYEFQTSTGTGTSDNRHRPLLHQGHITGLTADGRSAEWEAGAHYYGVRR